MSLQDLALRVALSFIILLILMRIIGRKEISQMTFFNFVSAITIGSIGAALAVNSNLSLRNGIIALALWSIITLIVSILDIKSINLRKTLTGLPIIVIKNGKIVKDEMKRCRLDVDQLQALLRQKNVFSFSEVDYAIFETSGKLSVLKKEQYLPASKGDINKPIGDKTHSLPVVVVSEGKLRTKNTQKAGVDIDWLKKELEKAGYRELNNVFVAQLQTDNTLYIDTI